MGFRYVWDSGGRGARGRRGPGRIFHYFHFFSFNPIRIKPFFFDNTHTHTHTHTHTPILNRQMKIFLLILSSLCLAHSQSPCNACCHDPKPWLAQRASETLVAFMHPFFSPFFILTFHFQEHGLKLLLSFVCDQQRPYFAQLLWRQREHGFLLLPKFSWRP